MAILTLLPDGTVAQGTWSATGSATLHQAVDDLFGAPDDDTTYITGGELSRCRLSLASMVDAIAINSIILRWRARGDAAGVGQRVAVGIRLSSTDYGDPGQQLDGVGGAYLAFTKTWTTHPGTGLPFIRAELNAMEVWAEFDDIEGPIDSFAVTSILVNVDYVPIPAQIEAARHKASVRIRQRRTAPQYHSAQIPPYHADVLPFGNPAWSHYAIPTTADRGAGVADLTQRRVCTRLGWRLNLNGKPYFKPRDFDLRDYSVLLWRTWHSREVPSAQRQGVAMLDPGAGEVYDRNGFAWIENPAAARAGLLQIVKVAEDVQRLATDGLLIEPQRTNDALRSSYKDGLTGITTGGASTITADTTADHLLFEPGESGNSLKMVAGNPHSSDGTAAHPVTAAYAANDRITVSYYHKDGGGEAMAIRIQRSGGGSDYWNDTTGAWAVGPINNSMPVSSAKYARWVSKVIDVGAGTPTITATIVQPSGGTVSRVNRGGHLQIEKGRSATSPIITQAATVTRNKDDLKIENFTGKVIYDPARADGDIVFVPNWNSSELAGGAVVVILLAFKDASNMDVLRYSQSTLAFEFLRILAGTTYTASKATTVTRGTAYTLGFRAVSADGEEDLAAYTISVFVGGVKGTDASPGGAWALGANEYLYIGQSQAGADNADGHLRQLTSRPFSFSDAEHVDYP